jgi:hypothetical protein
LLIEPAMAQTLGVRKESMDPIGGGTTAVEIALPLF